MRPIATVIFTLMLSSAAPANPPAGRWKLLSVRDWKTELVVAVVEFSKADDGAWTGRLVARNPALGQVAVGGVTVGDGSLRVAKKLSNDDVTFEGVVTDNAGAIHGTLGGDRGHSTARLIPTDDERISRKTMTSRRELPPPLQEYVKLIAALGRSPAFAASAVELKAAVNDAGDDLPGVRLRLALVEESVRYFGGNGVRTHRRVVRAMPGGPAGLKLDRSDTKHAVTVNLAEVRAAAFTALDEHARAVAWVQDDRDGFVWQAIESEVTDAKP